MPTDVRSSCADRAVHPGHTAIPGRTAPLHLGRTGQHGPIWATSRGGHAALSWFDLPSGGKDALVAAIDAALQNRAAPALASADEVARLMMRVVDVGASGGRHLHAPCPSALLAPRVRTRVLLIDERIRAPRVGGGVAHRQGAAFDEMVAAARATHPDAEFWLARSTDGGTGRWLSTATPSLPPELQTAPGDGALPAMLRHVDHVYVLDASEGMLALLANRHVHVFGDPYYAGWGLTSDARALSGRTACPDIATLFNCVYLQLARYRDPVTHRSGTLDTLLDLLALQQNVRGRFADLRTVACVGIQWWKRGFVTPFAAAGGGTMRWPGTAAEVTSHETALLWGARDSTGLPSGIGVVRIEDGFLHSHGLGSDMIAPRSQIVDRTGLYFDASRPSDLTAILNDTDFGDAELARAAALRRQIVTAGLTKYNLGRCPPTWQAPPGVTVALVIGQVADDASIRLGTGAIRTADALLEAVRMKRPNAYIVYKPHPDVLSGNRRGLVDADGLADVVDRDADLLSLIDVAHEIHTLSSLAGFDALLRGKPVSTYGLPFYAGWGLTDDAVTPQPWRRRTLTLDMLTAGVLIRYPLYWDWQLRLYTTPEAVAAQLATGARRTSGRLQGDRLRPLQKAGRWFRNVLQHLLWRARERT
ncbi:Capsular polysaccharide biosynthesis/export periplasmic protein WcbA [Burkholderia cenocepacia]|uniref:capsular polysaccharide export protein, LipB/KpsS family n=1 Tax=Burkholderia cenocepacia TaxID=95486 RepID=UPI00192C92A5|nr:capsular biosynthesis protein [Burkholderia cenocepacia]CAD9226550.1 Capsular polysaccharide biosynthesis/export periplasmic protein WcbA [Burkholderia cenocepacia]